jgi:hypothetical protein
MNEFAALVARRVLEQLGREAPASPASAQAASDAASLIMVLAERDEHCVNILRKQAGDDAVIVFFEEPAYGRGFAPVLPGGAARYTGKGAAADKAVRYILPSLSCANMADLALGRAVGPVAEEVLRLLLSGMEVEVMEFAYLTYGDSAPAPLYSLYEGYRERLAGYGLVEFKRKSPEAFRHRENLVTEETVLRAANAGVPVLMVPAAAIVTPLALDAAKNLNIRIIKAL